jgi:DNA modification methylase
MDRPSSPKQEPRQAEAEVSCPSSWYHYYAGYSPRFVGEIVDYLRRDYSLGPDEVLADPWNGSGTTTQVTEERAVRSWGGDLNPAMVVVAKARLLGTQVTPSELSLCERILEIAATSGPSAVIEADPLRSWFKADSAAVVRAIEQAIAQLLDPCSKDAGMLSAHTRVASMSPLACFFYLALFRTTRDLVRPFRSSNPTWIKRPADGREKLAPSLNAVHDRFRNHVQVMSGVDVTLLLDSRPRKQPIEVTRTSSGERIQVPHPTLLAQIAVASSTKLPLKDNSVAGVVSSPPYCTRIDYAVATGPELAALGVSQKDFRVLRESLIGTSTIADDNLVVSPSWGRTCRRFLQRVEHHPSKASDGYYLKTHLQYFDGLARSLTEIGRVLKPGAPCVLVIQDSYYKEVYNDLVTIVEEMGVELGWRRDVRHDYPLKQVMARMHKAGRSYRKATNATESVVVFTTSS